MISEVGLKWVCLIERAIRSERERDSQASHSLVRSFIGGACVRSFLLLICHSFFSPVQNGSRDRALQGEFGACKREFELHGDGGG